MSELIRAKCAESSYIDSDTPIQFQYDRKLLSPFTQSMLYFGSIDQIKKPIVLKIPKHQVRLGQEWTGSQRAFNAKVPTPEPLALIEMDNSILGMLFEFVEGEQLNKQAQPEKRY